MTLVVLVSFKGTNNNSEVERVQIPARLYQVSVAVTVAGFSVLFDAVAFLDLVVHSTVHYSSVTIHK